MPFTDDQRRAIEIQNKTLLVSAAAGSGKTATLTQRILERVTDKENPVDISRLLVVTFTKSATRELRERISAALSEALAKDPTDKRLSRQLLLLPGANIRTIDSLCAEILRQNAEEVGISPHFRTADEAEVYLLSLNILDKLLEEGFKNELSTETPPIEKEELIRMINHVSDIWHDTTLSGRFADLHDSLADFGSDASLILSLGEAMRKGYSSVAESPWGKEILDACAMFLSDYILKYRQAVDDFETVGSDKEKEKRLPLCQNELAYLLELQQALGEGYGALQKKYARGFTFEKLSPLKADHKTAADEAYKDLRDSLKKDLLKLSEYLSYTEEEFLSALKEYGNIHFTLGKFLQIFEHRLFEEKKTRNICSFGDISSLLLQLLYREDGTLTETALHLRSSFDEVYIDEYKDVNPVQHKIFEALSTDRNRFMVGDIKQAIYGFRGADPSIFGELRKSFPNADPENDCPRGKIFLSQNFRSDEPILQFTNTVCRSLFRTGSPTVGYLPEDDLVCGKKGGKEGTVLPQMALFPRLAKEEKEALTEEFPDADLPTSEESEQRYVVDEIVKLLNEGKKKDGSPVEPRDIAVLFRSRRPIPDYKKDLEERGVPCFTKENADFFSSPEIMLVLCLLNTVNNPLRDIYLSGLLCSPIYHFSLDELFSIKKDCPAPNLYRCLLDYRDKFPDKSEKIQRFLAELERFRTMAEGMPCDRLLETMYRETGLLAMASQKASVKKNLLVLLNRAKQFEESSFQGLYLFIRYLNQLQKENKQLGDKDDSASENAVQLLTFHASKGLQYPIVFLANLSSKFHKDREAKNKFIFDSHLGLALELRDRDNLVSVKNPPYAAVFLRIQRKDAEEEMRSLYVALTRAQEKLYISGHLNCGEDTLRKDTASLKQYCTPYGILQAKDYIGWLLSLSNPEEYTATDAMNVLRNQLASPPVAYVCKQEEAEVSRPQEPPTPKEVYRERFSYVYPHLSHTKLPGKLSVSRLSPEALDEDLSGITVLSARSRKPEKRIPLFLAPKDRDESAQRGTATHRFLQFVNLPRLLEEGAESELRRLKEEQFLTEEDGSLVNLEDIEAFRRSPYPKEMLLSRNLYREFRFHTVFPAENLTASPEMKTELQGETVLVQGVIDCFYITKEGETVLLDYKTDAIPKGMEKEEFRNLLRDRHSLQLAYYSAAIWDLFHRLPDKVLVYSLPLGEGVEVNVKDYLQIISYGKDFLGEDGTFPANP